VRSRSWLDGLQVYLGVALLFCCIGVLSTLLELQSPSWVQWSGIKVRGETVHGLTDYEFRGRHYTIDNVHASAADATPRPTTVWLDPSHPADSSRAYIENALDRWVDFAFVAGWYTVGLLIVGAGLWRRHRRRRRRIVTMGQFGSGISDEVVRRILSDRRNRQTSIDVASLINEEP
jgi:hypothetical protein